MAQWILDVFSSIRYHLPIRNRRKYKSFDRLPVAESIAVSCPVSMTNRMKIEDPPAVSFSNSLLLVGADSWDLEAPSCVNKSGS